MTKFALIASLLLSTSAFADVVDVPAGTIALNSVAANVLGTEPLCPKGATCVTDGTIVQLSAVGGCLDKLLPLTYEKIGREIVVHAQVAVNEKSSVVKCFAAPLLVDSITLINEYPPFRIRFLGTGQTVKVE